MKRVVRGALVGALAILATTACGDSTGPESPIKELQIIDVTVGTGATAAPGKGLTVNYTGWIYDDAAADHHGKMFDASSLHGGSFGPFTLGIGAVIAGWDQGLVGMKVGGKRTLIIPPSLGYGKGDYGPIPGNSALVFDVELLNVQ